MSLLVFEIFSESLLASLIATNTITLEYTCKECEFMVKAPQIYWFLVSLKKAPNLRKFGHLGISASKATSKVHVFIFKKLKYPNVQMLDLL